mgnify:CR=1 FL=1
MKKTLAMLLLAAATTAAAQESRQTAFPTAEGYGRYATGGRGGRTYVVTTLDDCAENDLKEGTFRWAVKQPGKKIVTFKVCGTIYLTSALDLNCGDITILGQTAPGDGVCLADYPVTISCENAIIRYMRFRLGQRQVANHEGDGFGINGADNFIIDHCSVSWSIDECLSVSAATNGTIQWCIVSQALNDAGHTKGAHGYGGNWGGTNVTFSHNLIAQCTSRVPRLGGDTSPETNDCCDLRNNVFYNWGGNGCYGAEAIDVNFVNNYYKPGPSTDQRNANIQKRICAPGIRTTSYIGTYPAFAHDLHKWGHFYAEGNYNPEHEDMNQDNWTVGIENQVDASGQDGTWTAATKDSVHLRQPHEFVHVTTHTAQAAYDLVLAHAGASWRRDCVDSMIVAQVKGRWGRYASGTNGARYGQIDKQTDNVYNGQLDESQVENGAWPILGYSAPARPDSDGDGVPDFYESAWGLDESNPGDGAAILNMGTYKGLAYVEAYWDGLYKDMRLWNANCTEGGETLGEEEPTILCLRRQTWEHEISALTYKGYNSTYRRQLFADDIAINGQSGGIAAGQDQTLKLRPQQYTIAVPSAVTVKSIRIYGYSNYGGNVHVTELNGEKYAQGTHTITGSGGKQTLTIPLREAVSGKSLTITFAGDSQPCLKLYLQEEHETALAGDVNGDGAVDVADISSVISVMAGGDAPDTAHADVNGDGTVDVADISCIISIMAASAARTALYPHKQP